MKKIIVLLFFLMISFLYADEIYISPDQLPAQIIQFINKYFPNAIIVYSEMDRKSYELELSNGVEIEFYKTGEFKEIEGNYTAIPTQILPDSVSNTVLKTYPDTVITKIKKKWNFYEIKLNNMMELYIDINGQLLGQKFDD